MGSKLFPNVYNGKPRSGGYVAKNRYRNQNAKAPDAKGRVYVVSPGWHWIAIWNRKSDGGQSYGAVQLTDMSDEEARKYCAKPTDRDPHRPPDDTAPSDVPF
jgi:hypothetical protein